MSDFYAKNSLQMDRQLKVQKLSVPFVIVGNASSASVSISCDETSFVFFRTQGNDQITGALASGETATYSSSPNDGTGVYQALVKIQENVIKVVSLRCGDLVTGNSDLARRGSSTAITTGSGGGQSIMVLLTSPSALNASNTVDACLEVEYIVQE